jgi:glutamyl-tRNA synthetase
MKDGIKPRYDGHCRDLKQAKTSRSVVRFRNPKSGNVVFDDQVRGNISISNDELDDLVIARPDGSPTYNFTVVVDDMDMEISHVIRGDDHINNTPRQINIYTALGAKPPVFAHVPMILGEDGARLSRLGWSHGDQEIFSIEEMRDTFKIENVNRKAAAFDYDKLDWLNQHYMRTLPPQEVSEHLAWQFDSLGINTEKGPLLSDVVQVQSERCNTLLEMAEQSRAFYEDFSEFDAGAAKKHLRPVTEQPLRALLNRLSEQQSWKPEALNEVVRLVAEELEVGMGKVAQPLRVALSGTAVSPAIDKTLWLVGKERSLNRISHALEYVMFRASQA